MAAELGRDFDIIGEGATVGVLSDNIFDLLFVKSTAPAFHSVLL